MPGIFISYRREDSQGFAGRLADDLGERFGDAQVFRDVEISPGTDYTRVIRESINRCDLLLVVIGRRWLEVRDTTGQPRLFDQQDWVRLEIEEALEGRKFIIPVLVGGMTMPAERELPESIRFLARLQAFVLSDRRWQYDLARLGDMAAGILHIPPGTGEGEYALAENGKTSGDQARNDFLRELAATLAKERERYRRQANVRSLSLSPLLPYLFKGIKQLLVTGVVIVIGYFLIQNYGDPPLKRMVDDFIRFVSGLVSLG